MIFFEDESIRRIAYITGCTYEELLLRSYEFRINGVVETRFFGKAVDREHISYRHRKVCTVCLAEKLLFKLRGICRCGLRVRFMRFASLIDALHAGRRLCVFGKSLVVAFVDSICADISVVRQIHQK